MNGLSYLLQVNLYLLVFYLFYLVLLRNETFFRLNRIYLISTSALALLIPVFQSEWIKSLFVTEQVYTVTQNLNAVILIGSQQKLQDQSLSVADILSFFYYAGFAVVLIRFLFRLYSLKQLLQKPIRNRAFSFFNSIIIDETYAEKATILKHEQVHAREFHSADIIFYELLAIVNWFNPVVYGYKKAIRFIHEFIADENAVAGEKDKSAYAMLLLNNSFGLKTQTLTNNFFNQSLLKWRIIMLHKKRSNQTAILKYGLSAPLFAAMVIFSSATIKESATAETLTRVTEVKVSEVPSIINSNKEATKADSKKAIVVNKILKKELISFIKDTISKDKSIHDFASVEILPEFPGGMREFYKYVGKNYHYPAMARKQGVSGRITLRFIVEKDGSLSNIMILKDLGMGTGEEAVRVLKASPKWKPGIQNGKPVRVSYVLPIMLDARTNPKIPLIAVPSPDALNVPSPPPSVDTTKLSPEFLSPLPSNVLCLLDGKEIKADEAQAIPSEKIEAVNVYKGQDAIDKYGEKGKNGVVEIITKSKNGTAIRSASGVKVLSYKSFDGLLIIDGKETDNTLLQVIDPKKIEAVKVLKGDDAVKAYGNKGKNGVILITTKKNP